MSTVKNLLLQDTCVRDTTVQPHTNGCISVLYCKGLLWLKDGFQWPPRFPVIQMFHCMRRWAMMRTTLTQTSTRRPSFAGDTRPGWRGWSKPRKRRSRLTKRQRRTLGWVHSMSHCRVTPCAAKIEMDSILARRQSGTAWWGNATYYEPSLCQEMWLPVRSVAVVLCLWLIKI